MLVVIGTLAIHTILLTAGDAVATFTRIPPDVAPQFELFDITDSSPAPPPPPPPPPEPPPVAPPEPHELQPQPQPQRAHAAVATHAPVRAAEPIDRPPDQAPPAQSPQGGGPTVAMEDIAPAARGVAVARGPSHAHVGQDGAGDGAGSGRGAGDAPVPMSVATIKTRALPHGDYSYFGAGKDYPAEAKMLGIEGVIRMRLIVDATGKVTSATALNQLGHGLDELADHYAHAIVFDPARDSDDKPVASIVVWTFHFTLPS